MKIGVLTLCASLLASIPDATVLAPQRPATPTLPQDPVPVLSPSSVRLSPLPVAAGPAGAGALLDRDTTTVFSLVGQPVEVVFEGASPVRSVKVFDPAPCVLRLSVPSGAGWQEVDTLDLSGLPRGWSRLPVRGAPVTDRMLVELMSTTGDVGGLSELEFWSESAYARDSGEPHDLLARIEAGMPPFEARLLPAHAVGDGGAFSVTLPWHSRELRRAYVVYELRGLAHWSGVSRSINGKETVGVALAGLSSEWGRQVEEIDPDLLARGENRVDFQLPEGMERADSVRQVALLVEVDDGRNFVDEVATDPAGPLTLHFEGTVQLEGLAVEVVTEATGRVELELLDVHGFTASRAAVLVSDLKSGWSLVPLESGSEVSAIRVSSGAALQRVVPIGSGVGRGRMPARLRVTHPDAGQFAGREAYLRGFVSPADDGTGPARVTVAGLPAGVADGAFAAVVDKDDVGLWDDADEASWSLEVVATYPGGTVLTRTVHLTQAQPAPRSTDEWLLPGRRFEVRPDSPRRIRHDEAGLDLEAGAVDEVKDLKVTPLREEDLPALDLGMTNVTRGPRRGYRFEPHGTRFARPVKVSLPFDPARLPPGFTEEDVRTFYFDEEVGRWVPLPRIGVDAAAGQILSTTDHFTDMINATVTVPEHAQLAAHDKNAMKDVPFAEPGAGITLMEPPLATSTGETRLTYPLALPQGRGGMQPSLTIGYAAGAGNGWLGQGWDLGVPSISVETRWGVPRYDGALETESYLLQGEPLTPVAHREAFVPRAADRVFHQRVEGAFHRIVRRGATPETYTWEVTDKKGTTSWYGADPATGALDPGAVLADDAGHVFRWLLREMRDASGNGVRFGYALVTDPGIPGGMVQGRQLYLKSIEYTRHGDATGPYTVTFVRDAELGEPRRPDVQIDARGGFKMVTSQLLRRIDVAFQGAILRSYELVYARGAFEKSLLQSVTQRGEDGSVLHTHRFTYYDEIRDGEGYAGFFDTTAWDAGDDDVRVPVIDVLASTIGSDAGKASALSGYETEQAGAHLYAGYNPGPPTKQGSVGGKVGFSGTLRSEGLLALIDLNGDGLPDKVFRDGGDISFRMNQSGPTGPPSFGPAIAVATLPSLSRETSMTASFGGEAYPGLSLLANVSLGISSARTYVSDVNGDGLPDLVHGGNVLFNRLDATGVPTFLPDSAGSPVPVEGGAVDASGLLSELPDLQAQVLEHAALHDTVRRWIAPYPGHVRVTGDVALAPGAEPPADGVRVAIQKNGTELWSATIDADDISPHAPQGVADIEVSRGDRLYFRLQSVNDGSHDAVTWDPEIVYLNVPARVDANLLDPYRFRASEDFTFAGRPGTHVQAPFAGRLHLEGNLQKTAVTTDDVVVRALRNGIPVHTRVLDWDDVATADMTINFDVVEGDTVELRVFVDSPIDLTTLQWVPRLYYLGPEDGAPAPTRQIDGKTVTIARVRDDQGNPLVQLHPVYDIDAYPEDGLTAPQDPWVADEDEEITVTSHLVAASGASGRIFMTAKRGGQLVAKRSIFITNGVVLNNAFTFDVEEGDEIFLDFSCLDPDLAAKVGNRVMKVDGDEAPSAFRTTSGQGVFPRPYRGWAVAGYSGNSPSDGIPIVESELSIEFDKESDYDPRTSKAHLFVPSPEDGVWRGPESQTYASPAGLGSSRLGPDSPIFPESLGGGRAPARISVSRQTAASVGALFLSGSLSSGGGRTDLDFLDLNGDRFPDVVGEGRVQYTNPRGGLQPANQAVANLAEFRSVDSDAKNVSVGGSPASFNVGSGALVDTPGAGAAPKQNDTGSQMMTLGLSGSLGSGSSTVKQDLVDLNGDTLPDRVRVSSGGVLEVALNLGYAFASFEAWGTGALSEGESDNASVGGNLGFNGGIYDYGGGVSLDRNSSETKATLMDLNGDALPDRIRRDGGALRVGLNSGSGFLPDVLWTGAPSGTFAATRNATLGGGAYVTIPIGPLCLFGVCWVILNPGADVGTSLARQETALLDLDGDGLLDHVSSTDDAVLTVARNTTGRTNLLRRVERPLHAAFDLEYARDGNTGDQPQSRWVLSRVAVFDGHPGDGVDSQVATFRYEGGVWDRLEREFYGYGRVIEELRDVAAGEAVYRTIVREFRTDSFYTKGLVQRERTEDGAGRPFLETEYAYAFADETGAPVSDLASTTATVFPGLARIDRRFYEGEAAPGKATYELQEHDALGNLTRQFDAGDPGTQDDLEATMEYASCTATHIVGVPVAITVRGNGAELRRRRAAIDCISGDLTRVTAFLEGGTAAETELEYDAFGNVTRVVRPPNASGRRYETRYAYDDDTHTYVTRVTDSFGYTSTSEHDPRWGKPLRVTDPSGNAVTYTYDAHGRALTVRGPYEQAGPHATVAFDYHPEAAVPWARTRQLDRFRSLSDPIDAVVFVDGLEREIQRKTDATVFRDAGNPAQDVMVVSGRQSFDAVGRVITRWHPVTEPLGAPGTFNATFDSVTPTQIELDVLDRVTRTAFPDGTEETSRRGFGADREGAVQFEETATDRNGIETRIYRNVRELVTGQKDFLEGTPIWTSFAYDAVDQIVRLTDDHGNVTRVGWDNLGRKTFLDSPDQGKTEAVYDLAGNQVAKITANLRARGQRIAYEHDFNRLVRIRYPDFPGNDVTYAYGPPGASDNAAGRVVHVTDQAGTEERTYGKLGEVVSETRSVFSATGPTPEVYRTEYLYDTFGRLQQLLYPDGERLTYLYDAGGKVRAVSGRKGATDYAYLHRLEYDKFGHRVLTEAGNGTRTLETYRPDNQRLQNISALGSEGPFLNLGLTYDGVGNVLNQHNAVAVPPPSRFGGPTQQVFRYDDLHRLTASEASYQFAPDKVNRYRAVLDYDTIDNLTIKTQQHEIVGPSGGAVRQHKTSYDYRYAYGGPQPHAVTHVGGRTFGYDANGNQAGWQDDRSGTRRTVVWDEENRIQSLFENGHQMRYVYDDQGERVIKRGPQGETVYVNPYFTVRNRERATKHVWVGGKRLTSKLVKPNTVEKDQYYYHADPVGSTSYVTDVDGRLYEHFEYFPFGETWVQESSNTQRTPYAFTGKELDEETGLYSMGVRYYDPRLSTFNSTEPLLFAQPEKGREEPKFLSAYQYAFHNPVRNVDPDGRDVLIIVGYDKDKAERQRFVNTADNLTKSLGSGVNVHRLEIGSKGDAAKLIAARAAEIGKGKVSTVVWIGHGETSGQGFLPRSGESLSIDDAVQAAGIVKGGSIVAIGCKVQQNIHTNELRARQIKFYGTMDNFLFKDKTGQVSISPTRKPVNPWQDPADVELPEATRKIDPVNDNCGLNGCVFKIGPSILETEKSTGKANAPMK